MKNRRHASFFYLFWVICCCSFLLRAEKDVCIQTDDLVVRNNSIVRCNETVAGPVCVAGDVSYQKCSGGLFPVKAKRPAVQGLRGLLCFSTGGVLAPESFSNVRLETSNLGQVFTIPLLILSLQANPIAGCGFSAGPLVFQSRGFGRGNEFFVVTEVSVRVLFDKPFADAPVVGVAYISQSEDFLLPCTVEDLFPGDMATAMWVDAQVEASDVTPFGFVLTTLFYMSVATNNAAIDDRVLVPLNRFINQVVNKSGVSFIAEGRVAKRTCC